MSDAEREVLKVLWDHGLLPVRQVLARLVERGHAWTRSTAITLLQRLEKKGYVASDKSRYALVFRPLVSREDVMHARMSGFHPDGYWEDIDVESALGDFILSNIATRAVISTGNGETRHQEVEFSGDTTIQGIRRESRHQPLERGTR